MIVDRLVRGKDAPQRRLDSIETAFARGLGRCGLLLESGTRTFVRGWRCSQCGTDHLEPEINLFRFNSSLGACPRCEGSGWGIELDLDRIIPDRSMSIRNGAIAPWSTPAHERLLQDLLRLSSRLGVPIDVPFSQLTPEQVAVVIEGQPDAGFPGVAGFWLVSSSAPGGFPSRSSSAGGGAHVPARIATGIGFAPRRWRFALVGSISPNCRPCRSVRLEKSWRTGRPGAGERWPRESSIRSRSDWSIWARSASTTCHWTGPVARSLAVNCAGSR